MRYIAPMVSVTIIELESGICAGSASIRTHDTNNQIFEDWEEQEEPSRPIDR